MKNQIEESVKQQRKDEILLLQNEIVEPLVENRLNKTYEVVVEGVADDGIFYYGRSYGESPEIDPAIYFTSKEPLEFGTFVKVKILNIEKLDLIGDVII